MFNALEMTHTMLLYLKLSHSEQSYLLIETQV